MQLHTVHVSLCCPACGAICTASGILQRHVYICSQWDPHVELQLEMQGINVVE
jgi:hypothetical protein